MSIQVNDFKYIPGENDAEYIKLLKEALERQKQITSKAIAKIKELSNASESPNGWTPVSKETNPLTSGWYIVTCPEEMTASNERFSSIAEYNAVIGEWFDIDEPTDCYLAWQPLPDPYKGDGR